MRYELQVSGSNGKDWIDVVPKLCGGDVELGNSLLGLERALGSGREASRALLRRIEGVSATGAWSAWGWNAGGAVSGVNSPSGHASYATDPQDWGRKYLPSNGGCAYIDLDHIELCIPEVLSAWDHVAATHAMLRILRGAQERARRDLPEGLSLQVLVNNSDGLSNSYGSHLNFLITRRAWSDLFRRKLHHLLFLASYQVSSIVFTGQGKVGCESGRPPTRYQLSQRADFIETLTGPQTTYARPIVNSRDEALCGSRFDRASEAEPGSALARLHCIFFDNTLCHVASLLKVGVMQIVLAMVEAGAVELGLLLDDPVDALLRWSHDARLETRCRLASGVPVTAVELQQRFLAAAEAFHRRGGLAVVPRAGEILALWEDTLRKLAARDLPALVGRLDWVLKRHAISRCLDRHPELDWESPEVKHLDLVYGSLDPRDGLYWHYEAEGVVERVVSEDEIERFVHEPPEDTRAWTRAMLLRAVDPEQLEHLDWDAIGVRLERADGGSRVVRLRLDDPLAFTRARTEGVFRSARSLEELVRGLARGDAGAGDTGSRGAGRWPELGGEGRCARRAEQPRRRRKRRRRREHSRAKT